MIKFLEGAWIFGRPFHPHLSASNKFEPWHFFGEIHVLWLFFCLFLFSDAGSRAPESCIFGQFLNMAAVIGIVKIFSIS